jgi:hypothetical protein
LGGRATPTSCLVAARGYGHAGGLANAEPTLVAKPQTPAPQGGSACPGGPPCGRGDRGCPNAFRAVRPLPVRVATGLPWCAGWGGRCPAGYDGAGGVRNPVRSWRPWWTSDTTARTSDRDQACGGPASSTGARVTTDRSRCWWRLGCRREHPHSRPVRSGLGRAGRVVGRGQLTGRMVGRWALEVSAAWRRRPDGVRTHRRGGHIELEVSGRPDVREVAVSVTRPARN